MHQKIRIVNQRIITCNRLTQCDFREPAGVEYHNCNIRVAVIGLSREKFFGDFDYTLEDWSVFNNRRGKWW